MRLTSARRCGSVNGSAPSIQGGPFEGKPRMKMSGEQSQGASGQGSEGKACGAAVSPNGRAVCRAIIEGEAVPAWASGVCVNCGQWVHLAGGDCVNECRRRGFADVDDQVAGERGAAGVEAVLCLGAAGLAAVLTGWLARRFGGGSDEALIGAWLAVLALMAWGIAERMTPREVCTWCGGYRRRLGAACVVCDGRGWVRR